MGNREHRAPLARAVALALCAALAGPVFGQAAGGALSGQATVGIRSVDTGGSFAKYREDVNLDDGLRLFDASLSYRPDPDTSSIVDRFDFRAESLGGEPFASLSLTALKRGRYDLRINRTRSEYFYQDTILPAELASISGETGGDFHHFDFRRTRDTVRLDIDATPATTINVDLERYTREGDSTTTLDLERDGFELDRPLDETLTGVTAGIQHRWDRMTLLFEQDSRRFDNTSRIFLPGASIGQNPDDPTELSFFSADQSYDYDSQGQLLRLIGRPTDRLDLIASWRHEDLDLDMSALETAQGTSFDGSTVDREDSGTAAVTRDIDLHDLQFGYRLKERIRLIGTFRHSKLDQNGRQEFADEQGLGLWDIDTTGAELGVELALKPSLVVAVGAADETRDVNDRRMHAGEDFGSAVETDRTGYFVRVTARLREGLDINASFEDDDVNDPYALAAPTDSRRYRLRLRQRWTNGVAVSATLRETTLDNRVSRFSGDTSQADLRVNLDRERFSLGGGIALIDLSRDIAQLVTAGTRQDLFLIDYAADIVARDLSARWRINDRVTVGGRFYRYENDGSFALNLDDQRLFVDVGLTDTYLLHFGLRHIDHREDRFDDYDADLVELSLSMRW